MRNVIKNIDFDLKILTNYLKMMKHFKLMTYCSMSLF